MRRIGIKVLITGASGKIGSLARYAFRREQVTLMSRTRCECSADEKWIACPSLDDVKWWSNQELDCEYDIVLHLAEPVKKLALEHEVLDVIDSHVAFLRNASKKSRFVFYPQTALIYDRVLSKSETSYLRIKMDVVAKTKDINNLMVPVIHPIIDYGDGLAKMCELIKKIPLVNLFCGFKSTIPVLYKHDLESFFMSFSNREIDVRRDYYSGELMVSEIFSADENKNLFILSLVFRSVLSLFKSFPKVALLLNGRRLP